jgi:protoporphyrinogen IX oxidase
MTASTLSVYLTLKTLHILFVTSWFVGLFYAPRILVNMAQEAAGNNNPAVLERLELMMRRLLRFTTILAIPALGFGLAIVHIGFIPIPHWLWIKLLLVIFIIGYHHSCYSLLKRFLNGQGRSVRWYKIYNEIPVLIMLAIIALVLFKPS